jgi:hypothetical protein
MKKTTKLVTNRAVQTSGSTRTPGRSKMTTPLDDRALADVVGGDVVGGGVVLPDQGSPGKGGPH